MENKNKTIVIAAIILIIITIMGLTYAFFELEVYGNTSQNAIVTSNTTDLLTFNINQDISFVVTQADFVENGNNKYGEANATATLTPNNKTGNATMYYYLYLNIENNPFVYSSTNTNEDPELMLQVFDDNNELVVLSGFGEQKTIKGVTGYDITNVIGLKKLLNNHAISATNNTAAIENWRIVITLINLDVNQSDNTGKTFEATIIIIKDDTLIDCEIDPSSCLTLNVQNKNVVVGKTPSFVCDDVNATWNRKYQQLEVSTMGSINECTLTYETTTGTVPLNSYVISLDDTIQGDGKVVHEIGIVPDFDDMSAVTTFGETPMIYKNNSTVYTTQAIVDDYWTFDSTTGTFTSNPSLMTDSSMYYHVYLNIPTDGFYQMCYTIGSISDIGDEFSITKNGYGIVTEYINNKHLRDKCIDLDWLESTDYLNIAERADNGTNAPQISFVIKKANSTIQLDTGYRYEGKNPNNYVMFNNELWRIIGVFDSSSHGQNGKNLVKIIRTESLGGYSWDNEWYEDWENVWPTSKLFYLLNMQYYNWKENKQSVDSYCYASTGAIPGKCDYSVVGIQDEYRAMVENVTWYLNTPNILDETYTNNKWYYYERNVGSNSEPTNKWCDIERGTGYSYECYDDLITCNEALIVGGYDSTDRCEQREVTNYQSIDAHVGLLYVSDYGYGVLKDDCEPENTGYRVKRIGQYNNANCAGNNWLFKGKEYTISSSKVLGYIYQVTSFGNVIDLSNGDNESTRPVLYLASSVYKISGTGTQSDPYIIGM